MKKMSPHMQGQKETVPEQMKLTKEARYQAPTLEEMYWANPNEQKGSIARCVYDGGVVRAEVHEKQGI